MIKYMKIIDNINEYQCGKLPANAQKLDAPATRLAIMVLILLLAIVFYKHSPLNML